jgi:hypothetical protein
LLILYQILDRHSSFFISSRYFMPTYPASLLTTLSSGRTSFGTASKSWTFAPITPYAVRHTRARVNTDTGFHPEMPLDAFLS